MRLLYFTVGWGDIILCDVPPRTAYFRPWWGRKEEPAKWVSVRVHPKRHPTWGRVPVVLRETSRSVQSFHKALRDAVALLPQWRRTRGVLGVMLRDFPDDGFRQVGFFHVLSMNKWDKLSKMSEVAGPPPEGLPAHI